jgi:hypothetical protein
MDIRPAWGANVCCYRGLHIVRGVEPGCLWVSGASSRSTRACPAASASALVASDIVTAIKPAMRDSKGCDALSDDLDSLRRGATTRPPRCPASGFLSCHPQPCESRDPSGRRADPGIPLRRVGDAFWGRKGTITGRHRAMRQSHGPQYAVLHGRGIPKIPMEIAGQHSIKSGRITVDISPSWKPLEEVTK